MPALAKASLGQNTAAEKQSHVWHFIIDFLKPYVEQHHHLRLSLHWHKGLSVVIFPFVTLVSRVL